jgi:DNA polymerase-3 subunit alpha
MSNQFVHLHVHSNRSFLDSSAHVKDIISRAKDLGQPAVALTDHGVLFNAVPFYKAAKKAGIRPILGCEFDFVEDCDSAKAERQRSTYHIILLAENNKGWKNIVKLVSASNSDANYYYKPRIDFNLLEKHSEGVIALTACRGGVVSADLHEVWREGELVKAANPLKAAAILRRLIKIFGTKSLFLELQDHGDGDELIHVALRDLGKEYGVRTVATNNVHYTSDKDAVAYVVLRAISKNQYVRRSFSEFAKEEYYLKSREEMENLSFTQDELDATIEISKRCDVTIDFDKKRMPVYPFIPNGMDADSYLKDLVRKGAEWRSVSGIKEYEDRIERELADINKVGFADYFLFGLGS